MDLGLPGLELGGLLHRDAVAESYEAMLDGSAVTVRILREDHAGHDHALLLFQEEGRRIGRLGHDALLRVRSSGTSAGRPWMVADPIGGITLADQVLSVSPLPEAQARSLVAQLHEAFRYLQARKQVHVEPTPTNLVRVGGGWRFVTFQAVRAWDELRLRKGKKVAWPAFAPPEQAREHPEALRPEPFLSWSLGVLLRWAAAGVAPDAPLPDFVSPELSAIIDALLRPDPAARPQGQVAVERTLAGTAPGSPDFERAPVFKAPVRRRRKRRP